MKSTVYGALALSMLAAAPLSGCNEGRATESAAASPPAALPVAVVRPERREIRATYRVTGTLSAESDAPILARAGGQVVDILVEEGDAVRRGQVLARLDGDRTRLELARAQAEYERQTRELERRQNLFDRGLVSRASFESLAFDVAAARAAWQRAQLDHEYTTSRSTIDGIVSERRVRHGASLQEKDVAFQVTNTSTLLAYLDIPQIELSAIESGKPALLRVDAVPTGRFDAVVQRISPTIDPHKGTFRATLLVDNPGGLLAPGMLGRFAIDSDLREDALVVPASAVVHEDRQSVVFVVVDDDARRRIVETGIESDGHVEIVSGLTVGDRVVLGGQSRLRDGGRVLARAGNAADKPGPHSG